MSLPDQTTKADLTVFMELDDILFHTYIYDENFGFMADPAPREPDHKLHFGPKNFPINVYMRDHYQDFLNFLKENKSLIEPIVYTSGVPEYTNMLLALLDPKGEVFDLRLYQPACHIFEKKDENIFMMIKDITRF